MSRIFVTGDTHGYHDIMKLQYFLEEKGSELTKDDYVIICGDVGCVWGDESDNEIQDIYRLVFPWTTLFVGGNHENWDLLNAYPVTKWKGGDVHIINDKLIHLMNGQIFTIDGLTFFTMGGAESTDKEWRIEGESWWPQEIPSDAEFKMGFKNLDLVYNKVNYIITHTVPDHVLDTLRYRHDEVSNFLELVYLTTWYKHWYCGHHHIDAEGEKEDKLTFLYNEIKEI